MARFSVEISDYLDFALQAWARKHKAAKNRGIAEALEKYLTSLSREDILSSLPPPDANLVLANASWLQTPIVETPVVETPITTASETPEKKAKKKS